MERGRNRWLPKVLAIHKNLSLSLPLFSIYSLSITKYEQWEHLLCITPFISFLYIYIYIYFQHSFSRMVNCEISGPRYRCCRRGQIRIAFSTRSTLSLSLSLGALYQIKIWCKLHVITLPRVHYTAQAFHGTPPSLEEWRTPAPFSYPCGHVSRLMER